MDGRGFLRVTIVAAFIALCLPIRTGADTRFPEFESIKPNVAFWLTVYSRYTTSQAIIHDSRRLDIIYDVIDVRPYDAPGARKVNRSLTKRAKAKYETILAQLAADPDASAPEARRVKGLFGADATPNDFRNARNRVRSQIGQKDRFRAGLMRSGAYIDQIRAIFSAYGLPEKLAYLPHVESSFDLKAYSKFGAAGIWQFTRSTGRRFMTVGYVLDERRDPIAATHGAAKLLKENFEKLGSWPLAITAYNHGAAGMARAKRAHGGYPRIFDAYRSRSFKFASRNFYSEFLAASRIAADPTAYFGTLQFEKPVRYRTVTLGGYASL
ncbi:MAG: lytic transglycosylase domain-containing protein, partial [Desulfobacterales bacterium]